MVNMKEYPKIDQLFSANSEKLIPEDKERIVVEYMADIDNITQMIPPVSLK